VIGAGNFGQRVRDFARIGESMTTLLERAATELALQPKPHRRWWLRAIVAVVVLALLGGGIGWYDYVRSYQPLTLGNGPYSSVTPKTLKTLTDGVNDTELLLVGPSGTTGTADYPLWNDGNHSVTIDGLDRSGLGIPGLRLTWTPSSPGPGDVIGAPGQGRAFPVTIPPHDQVILQLTVVKLVRCAAHSTLVLQGVGVRWSSLGGHHTWQLPMREGGAVLPIAICGPNSALKYVDKF
jgi:hypothetical protein